MLQENGINVNAAASDRIVLRGLDINGAGFGVTGISFTNGGSLHVEDSVISGMTNGINVTAGSEVYIKNSYIRNNSNIGIYINSSSGLVNVVIEKSTVENQTHGLYAGANTRVSTRGSVYSGHTNIGVFALGGGSASEVNVDNSIVTSNGVGLYSGGRRPLFVSPPRLSLATTLESLLMDRALSYFSDNKLQGNTWNGGFNLELTSN